MDCIAGKVALITGGAGGIGLAVVKNLLQHNAKGVSIVDISEQAGHRAVAEIVNRFEETKITFIKADVTKILELEGAFETTIKKYQQLDIVINNAGQVDEFDRKGTVEVNLIAVIEGTYLAMQKYLPKYKSGEEGLVINVASVGGLHTFQVTPIYCTTKHGLIGLGRSLGGSEFYKTYKVRIVTVCPGLVRTPMSDGSGRFVFPELKAREFGGANLIVQEPERIGQEMIEVINKGKNGSLWVIENNVPAYEVVVPHYRTMTK